MIDLSSDFQVLHALCGLDISLPFLGQFVHPGLSESDFSVNRAQPQQAHIMQRRWEGLATHQPLVSCVQRHSLHVCSFVIMHKEVTFFLLLCYFWSVCSLETLKSCGTLIQTHWPCPCSLAEFQHNHYGNCNLTLHHVTNDSENIQRCCAHTHICFQWNILRIWQTYH